MSGEICRCGHERAAHKHYRPGAECALCAPGECTGFRRPGVLGALWRLFGR
ncbi:hypothetical protein [Mycolicibacterium neoaurum]|uniref:hypothetical protein n=1 Tax=Mycolicibacterium neoaurum TaxID=1795 RepID=UPI00141FAD27|nr:hypothetical protein [Mycolicibacterium neoaurum]